MKRVAHEKRDILKEFVGILKDGDIPFCVIGDLAVNAYAEPVVSLDLDIVIVAERIDDILKVLGKGYKVERFPNSINISSRYSDLRIQLRTDPRYQEFIGRAHRKDVLGYKIPVAAIEDVLKGKVWAASDENRRKSKRQKDLADILRLLEAGDRLVRLIPDTIRQRLSL